MGIFGRDDADDLYRGDAPVSQPGRDGADPVEYLGGNPAGDRTDGHRPSQATLPPAPGPGMPAATRRPSRPGCLLAVVLLVLVIFGGAGLVIFAIFQSATSSTSASGPAVTTAGQPLTITSNDGDLVVTILGATAQPGGAWGDNDDPAPNFVVELSVELVNAPGESVITSTVGWRFAPGNGSVTIEPTESGGYRPSMIAPRVAPNVVSSGYLAFSTAANSGILSVLDSTGRLAQWELTASTPSAVVATAGEPVRGGSACPLSPWRWTVRRIPTAAPSCSAFWLRAAPTTWSPT